MSTHILGGRVHDDVGTLFNRPPQKGRGNGVIDDQRNAGGVRNLCQAFNINNAAGRVTDRLTENGFGALIDQLGNACKVVLVGKAGFNALARQGVGE